MGEYILQLRRYTRLESTASIARVSSALESLHQWQLYSTKIALDIKMRHSGTIIVSPKSKKEGAKQDLCQSIARLRLWQKEVRMSFAMCGREPEKITAAWDFHENHKSTLGWDLVTFCMPWVGLPLVKTFGPILYDVLSPDKLNESVHLFYEEIFGNALQAIGYPTEGNWVDVRDVARGHIRSLQVPEAGGNRFILSKEPYIWQDWCTHIFLSLRSIPIKSVLLRMMSSTDLIPRTRVFS